MHILRISCLKNLAFLLGRRSGELHLTDEHFKTLVHEFGRCYTPSEWYEEDGEDEDLHTGSSDNVFYLRKEDHAGSASDDESDEESDEEVGGNEGEQDGEDRNHVDELALELNEDHMLPFEAASIVSELAISDDFKVKLIEHGILPLLVRGIEWKAPKGMLEVTQEEELLANKECANALFSLCLSDLTSPLVRADPGLSLIHI